MSKPVARDVALVIAGYPTVESATRDWHRLKEARSDEDVRMYDLAVVQKTADGTVKVVKNLHHKVRRGLIVGGVLALVTPLGLAAGLVGGAAAGKIASHLHKGMAPNDIRDLGDLAARSDILLLALMDEELTGVVTGSLESDNVTVGSTTTTEADFDALLAEYGIRD